MAIPEECREQWDAFETAVPTYLEAGQTVAAAMEKLPTADLVEISHALDAERVAHASFEQAASAFLWCAQNPYWRRRWTPYKPPHACADPVRPELVPIRTRDAGAVWVTHPPLKRRKGW